MKARSLAEPILVGRERELAELMRNLDLAIERRGTTILVSGEAGAGKTRLINEFLAKMKEKEIAILYGWCLANVTVPYFPFMEAFKAYYSAQNPDQNEPSGSEIKAWLLDPKPSNKSAKLQDLSPQAWQDLTFAAVTNTLLSISSTKPAILFLDDLHWADSASLSLLHYISRSIRSSRILVLATFRSEELNPDEEGQPHPLLETLRLMRREDLIKEIKLPSLDQASVATLAEKIVGGRLHSKFAERLSEESQGNPLFVVETLRMLSEQGNLVQDRGQWQLSIEEIGIPLKIKDIILRRVEMLKPNQRRILDLASVIGEKFDVELLGTVLGKDSLEVLEALNIVGQSSSLVFCEGSVFEFDHAKSREAIYEQISPPLKRGYHARVAEKMEARAIEAKDVHVNDLAYHYAQAGYKEKAVKYSLTAGEYALARFSNEEAKKHFSYVLHAADAPKYSDEMTAALEGLGDALSAGGLFDEALETFEKLSNITENDVAKLRALRKALVCTYWVGNSALPLKLSNKAEEYTQSDRLEYARFRLQRGFMAHNMGKNEQAFADIDEALRLFEEECSLGDVARALGELIFVYLLKDRLLEQLVAGLRSVALYEELRDLRGQLWARSHLGWALRQTELFQEALDNTEASVRIGEKIGDYNTTALMLWGLGVMHELRGDHKAAIAETLRAADYAEKTNALATKRLCFSLLVREYAKTGEIGRSEEWEKKLDMLGKKEGHSRAMVLAAKGQWKEANEIFEKSLERKDSDPWGSGKKAALLKDYAWALAKQGRTEEARMQFEEAEKLRDRVKVELKELEHANVQAFLLVRREIGIGEELNVRLDLVNVSKKSAALVRVEGLIPSDFSASAFPSDGILQNGSLEKHAKLETFGVESVKLVLEAQKAGDFIFCPRVVYIDDKGETKTCAPKPVTVTVRPMLHVKIGGETISAPILPGRVATGFTDLDALLYGGIPAKHAVILTSPSTDERTLLIRDFLETGASAGEPTFIVTVEAETSNALTEKFQTSFFIVLCNPQADFMVQSLPNVFKLKGVENLTEIDIALTKAFRTLNPAFASPRRICIEAVSDVLLQHHAVNTRRWLSALLPTLKSKGFTILGVIDPQMHPPEELQSIVGIFDGEIRVTEKETPEGIKQTLRVRKLLKQKYLEKEIILTKEKPS